MPAVTYGERTFCSDLLSRSLPHKTYADIGGSESRSANYRAGTGWVFKVVIECPVPPDSCLRQAGRAATGEVEICHLTWIFTCDDSHGPRAPPYPPTKRSPTHSAAAVNANDPTAAGRRSPRPNATWCDWSVKASAIRTSPPGCSSHRAPCKPTSPTSTPNSDSPAACNSCKKQPATPERRRRDGRKTKPPIPLRRNGV
jgi:hypothetical protein